MSPSYLDFGQIIIFEQPPPPFKYYPVQIGFTSCNKQKQWPEDYSLHETWILKVFVLMWMNKNYILAFMKILFVKILSLSLVGVVY